MDPREKIIRLVKTKADMSQIVPETVRLLRLTLQSVKNPESCERAIQIIKKLARKIQEECPLAFPIFNLITRLLTIFNCSEKDKTSNAPKLLKLLSFLEQTDVPEIKSQSLNLI